jgi:amino acid transporter
VASAADRKLRRELTRWDLLGLSMGGIIGSGWLLGTNKAAAVAGPAVMISWIVGAIMVLFVALVWAEISGAMPRSGAIVRYPFYTHGSYTGFYFGWAYFLTAVSVPAIEVEAAISGISSVNSSWTTALLHVANTPPGQIPLQGPTVTELTPLGTGIALLMLIGFFFLNYFGVKVLGKTNTWVTVWKIIIPVLTFILLFTLFKSANFNPPPLATSINPLNISSSGGFAPYGIASVFYAIPTSGVFFAYLGFRQGLEYAGEAKRPQRDVPIVTIGAVILALVIYELLQVAYLGAINWGSAGVATGDYAALTSSLWAGLPLKYAVAAGTGAAYAFFAWVLIADSFISPAGTGWIYLGTSTRTLYGLSVEGYFPRAVHSIHERFRIPWVALVASVIIGVIFLVPLPSWYALVGFISSTSALTYVTGGAIVPALRKFAPGLKRPFKLPIHWFFAAAGFCAGAMVLFWSGFYLISWVYVVVFGGLAIYCGYALPLKLGVSKALSYTLALVTLVLLTILGYFGPMWSNNGVNTFLWSTGNGTSVILYFVLYGLITVGLTFLLWRIVAADKRREIAAGLWVPLWLFALYIVSYLTEFGPGPAYPYGGKPSLFPDGTVIALVVSALFFVWAALAAYKTDELKAIEAEGGLVGTEEGAPAPAPAVPPVSTSNP